MSGLRKIALIVLGSLSAIGILGQLVLGQLILSGNVKLAKAHQHSGYTTVVVTLVYIMFSLMTLFSLPASSVEKPVR